MVSNSFFQAHVNPIEWGANLLLWLLVFGMSGTVKFDNLKSQLQNRRAIGTGVFLQFFVLPFLGFLAVKSLRLDPVMGVMLLVVTSSPGGSYSNWWCSIFNADLALSVTMTTISTLLSVVMLPINLVLYANTAFHADVVKTIDWPALFVSLVIVISAIVIGLVCSAKIEWPGFNAFANKLGNFAGISLIVFSAVMANSSSESDLIGRPWQFYVGVAAPVVVGLIVSNIISSCFQLKEPERVTVSVECCYQNVGIATSAAVTMFKGSDLALALGVPLYYGIIEAVVLGLYCVVAWKISWTKAPAEENVCVVVATSYEAEEGGYQVIEGEAKPLEEDAPIV